MRRLIIFSDPGGAKPCLALAQNWQESGVQLVCSDRRYAFFDMFGAAVHKCTSTDAESILDEFHPEFIYTGTSYTSEIELAFLELAKQREIRSASFIDHYTEFQKRFEYKGRLVFPDQIDVLDERAKTLAIHAGLPRRLIQITGNPYHAFLRNWKPRLSKVKLWEKLQLPQPNSKCVLFAPDPLSNAGGVARFGNDEVGILSVLLDALNEVRTDVQLIIKAHPNQSIDYLKSGFTSCPTSTQALMIGPESDAYLNELIIHSDVVVGMISNVIAEADILGKQTMRILANISLRETNLPPTTVYATTKEEIINTLRTLL
jgi:hypothetical protein